ncbi:MAG: LuxR C-terminal-related transcriptional regulator [Candidatus Rokuibacteriota bacterium]
MTGSSGGLRSAVSETRVAYWRRRLFRNTFTRHGALIQVRGWSVKIQHQGRRRTFALGTIAPAEAAERAQRLYRSIVTRGWDAVATRAFAMPRPSRPAREGARPDVRARRQIRYWRPRLIRRQYAEGSSLTSGLSVRIEHKGTSRYFPLGTDDERQAATRASEIHRTVLAGGWELARARFRREITVAVIWSSNPLACTYTTLCTEVGDHALTESRGRGERPGSRGVAIVEADAEVRRAMVRCVDGHDGWHSVAPVGTAVDALRICSRADVALVLVSRNLRDMPGGQCVERLRLRRPDLATFTYGVHDDSDQLFLSFSGVSAGYILRRRRPPELLEPLGSWRRRRSASAPHAPDRVRRYFQSFFDATPSRDQAPRLALLTYREQEIIEDLSKGYVDKEIAEKLGISAWTVHGHLKSIFEKLRVHTRTEAVVTYLQK